MNQNINSGASSVPTPMPSPAGPAKSNPYGLLMFSTIAVSAILLFVWTHFAVPWFTSIPADFHYSADVISIDNFFDEGTNQFTGQVNSVTSFTYDTQEKKDNGLIIKNLFDVRTTIGNKIFAVERLYGIDPKTGKHINGLGDHNREGYLFAPKHINKEPFTYWHINYDEPAQLNFASKETLYGLKVYKYETDYHADQTENLAFLPEVGKTRGIDLDINLQVWVEPNTGWLVKYQDKTTAHYYDLETKKRIHPWNQFTNTYTEDSVKIQVKNAQNQKNKQSLLEQDITILFSILLLLAVSFLFSKSNLSKKPAIDNVLHLKVPIEVVATIVIGSGVLVIFGWIFSIDIFKRVFPDLVGMNPITAICFVLIGTTLILIKKPAPKLVITTITFVIFLAGAWRLLSLFFGFLPQIDLALFSQKMLEAGTPPSRMAPVTAMNISLLALAIFTTQFQILKKAKLGQLTSHFVAVSGLIGIISFLFSGFGSIANTFFFSLALPTAILFFIIGLFLSFEVSNPNSVNPTLKKLFQKVVLFTAIVVPVAITFSISAFAQSTIEEELQSKFDAETKTIEQAIVRRFEIYANALDGARGLFAASEKVEREEWGVYVNSLNLQKNYPGIVGVSYAPYLSGEDAITQHTKQVKAESGLENYSIKPAGIRPTYAPITFMEPRSDENLLVLGFDLNADNTRKKALAKARDSNNTAITDKVVLFQDSLLGKTQPGFLMVLPVYKNGSATTSLLNRQNSISGFVTVPFRSEEFLEGILTTTTTTTTFKVYDGTESTIEDSKIYVSGKNKVDPSHAPKFTKTKTVYPAGHPWTISYASSPELELDRTDELIPALILVGGITFTLLIFVVFYSLGSAKNKAIEYANLATANLVSEKSKLEQLNAALNQTKNSLETNMAETERINKLMVGREVKMAELKKENERLRSQAESG